MKLIVISDAVDSGVAAQTAWVIADDLAERVQSMLGTADGHAIVDVDTVDTSTITLLLNEDVR